jgi:hypothetical protein
VLPVRDRCKSARNTALSTWSGSVSSAARWLYSSALAVCTFVLPAIVGRHRSNKRRIKLVVPLCLVFGFYFFYFFLRSLCFRFAFPPFSGDVLVLTGVHLYTTLVVSPVA